MENKVYGFYFNFDTWESAASLISLHRSLRGAYDAMRKYIVDDYNKWYNSRSITGKQEFKHEFDVGWFIKKHEILY